MFFVITLGLATAVSSLALAFRRRFTPHRAARWGMAAAMAAAGVSHLFMPIPFVQHLPTWVPEREGLVAASGFVEMALGAALLARPPRQPLVGWVLAVYLVAVFPANVYVTVSGTPVDGQPGGLYPWLRLPLQPVFIAWALWCTRALPTRWTRCVRRSASTELRHHGSPATRARWARIP